MIEVDSLTKSFADVRALSGVSFGARRGEILGVLGPNGAGKTTTLRIVSGFLLPDAGRAAVDGLDVVEHSLEVRRRIGYLPENNPLYPEMRVTEYLTWRATLRGVPRHERRRRVAAVVDRCGLGTVARRTIGALSKGFRQRVGLADALVHRPPVLILDEPTSGLDPIQIAEVRRLVSSLRDEHTVLLSSHVLTEVEQVCDRVVIFRGGRVVAEDSMDALRARLGRGAGVVVEVAPDGAGAIDALAQGVATIVDRRTLDDGWLRVELEAESDPREALFARAVSAGVTLRELARRRRSLEDVFHQLAADRPREAAAGAGSPASPAAADDVPGETPGDRAR